MSTTKPPKPVASSQPASGTPLHGKVVLVTGASSGLGMHFARVLAAAGASVAVAARRVDRLKTRVDELAKTGATATAVALDVTDSYSLELALDAIEERLGPVTVLVNNAGVSTSKYCLNIEEVDWDHTLGTNLKGAWRVAQAVARRCTERMLPASIVNIASILGLRVAFGESAYATSKAALIQLTRSMALELSRKNIRVNALCPGYFRTELNRSFLDSDQGKSFIAKTPAQRAGDLSELNGPLLLLCSDWGSFINGIALPVDGGHLVSSL